MKILDCTLRDGGYYTNWDFDQGLIDTYIASFNNLPIDYLEIGYLSKPLKGYFGKYFYCPEYVMKQLREQSNKKLAVMLNEKDVLPNEAKDLLSPAIGSIDMFRLAVAPNNIKRAIELAKRIKELGFEVGFNVMYMSNWKNEPDFLEELPYVDGLVDYLYMVDSYGSVFPNDVKEIISMVRQRTNVLLGFHGHNNLELGLSNTLTAIENGVEIVDATVTGMGRGAGNLKIELLLTALNSKGRLEFDYNPLSKVVDAFTELENEHGWGTNLPYMVSGANSLPQKQVMEWVGKRSYSFNSIIRALQNQFKGIKDNQRLPIFNQNKDNSHTHALIIGGGPTALTHSDAIQKYLIANPDICVIHASAKNAMAFKSIPNKQIFCLVGNEGHRMEDVFQGEILKDATCILPTYPRKMGTYIPDSLKKSAFELVSITFTDKYMDSHTSIALQTAIELETGSIEIVGYDGYSGNYIGKKEQELFVENEFLFSAFASSNAVELNSLTPTNYEGLKSGSIYGNTK
jgi:4-hydroxy 2-oxovalerate aldolase